MMKNSKKKNDVSLNVKRMEILFSIIVIMIFIVLLVKTLNNIIFLPATLIMASLECFCIGYYLRDNEDKKYYVYGLFVVGVILLFISVIYTIVKTV